jgi:hypothetical protein
LELRIESPNHMIDGYLMVGFVAMVHWLNLFISFLIY